MPPLTLTLSPHAPQGYFLRARGEGVEVPTGP